MTWSHTDNRQCTRLCFVVACAIALGMLFSACGTSEDDDGYGTCPTPQDVTVASGFYHSEGEATGPDLGAPHANGIAKEMTVSREEDSVTITYTDEEGTLVTETWRIKGSRMLE